MAKRQRHKKTLFTPAEAGDLLGYTPQYLMVLLRRYGIPYEMIGKGTIVITLDTIQALKKRHKQEVK